MRSIALHVCITLLSIINIASGGQALNEEQIINVFQSLNNQTRLSWIPSGTIEGTHINVNMQAGEITTTNEKVKYDGNKFRWSITIESHQDLDQKPINNEETRLNKERVFTWDGNEYSIYFKSGKNSFVAQDNPDIPVNIEGPLKAGLVPWGHGICQLDELAQNIVSSTYDANGDIIMRFDKESEYTIEIKLDPAKKHAVILYQLEIPGKSRIKYNCSDYAKYESYWIPQTIVVERTENISNPNPKITHDLWGITKVDLSEVTEDQFQASFDDNTRVEYHTATRAMSYRHKVGRGTKFMLAHRKYNASLSGYNNRNCATAALLYIASIFGKDVNTAHFDGLVSSDDKTTSLLKIRDFLKIYNLNCAPLKTDLVKLSNLPNCMVILHLPKAKHYVILDHVDSQYAWLIDLDSDKFYYRIPIEILKKKWTDRTAMIVSDRDITLPKDSIEIPDDKLAEIKGSTSGFGTYSCTDVIQTYSSKGCSDIDGFCPGKNLVRLNRKACRPDPDGGYCSGHKELGSMTSSCMVDTFGQCKSYGEWKSYYLRACE